MQKKQLVILVLLFFILQGKSYAQSKVTLSGYVKDKSNGEVLIGATVYVKEISAGASTNVYGFYSLTIPPGNYTFDISYVGYQTHRQQLQLTKNLQLDVDLNSESSQLQEIVIVADEEHDKVQSLEMSTTKLDIKTIMKMPAFLGEADIIKSLQMTPGVSTVGEGASGFNVRGGSVGQNLLLLDEAPVFNSSHMLGFFSAFNPDAVKDVKLYKGGIPARYGGRLSSLLDIRMKEGNNKETHVQGGIGTVFSRIAVESPIVKDKGSFIIAGRRSYIDVLAAPILNNFSLNFYDLTAKANYKLNDKNKVYLSGYLGRDNFGFAKGQGLSWGSQTGTFRWNHLFNQKLFSNLSVIYSKYDYKLKFGDNANDRLNWKSYINNFIVKSEFSYFINSNNELNFGGELISYTFDPANTSGKSGGEEFNNKISKKYGGEAAAFVSNTAHISKAISVEYGVRLSNFRYMGPGPAYTFNDTIRGKRRSVVSERDYKRGETIASYTNWEPRLSMNFKINNDEAIKASYNRTVQYVHLVSNTVASNPLDLWTPSSNNIRPQVGDQYALGYFRNLSNNKWEASVEGYYRALDNQVDYINGAELLQNKYLEGDLLSGKGRAYGLEFYLQRKTGRLNGWLSYTLSRTELKIDGINRGEWYPALYDQTHNFKLAAFYEINKRWSVSSNFVFTTGTPTTTPTSKYYVQGIAVPHNANESKNNYRLTNYNRLDLAFRLEGKEIKRNGKPKKRRDYWVFSVYNLYARRNAFVVDFKQTDKRFSTGQVIETEAVRSSILGSIVPAISYNYKF
ncbi:MAG TPA: TonB-dependent receptor [Cyclobacteriaceae bacterium]|jgi:hypothetical protein|nr:TonB-dependent receptor [Cyclobacteriaceae bacterium]